MVRDAAQNVAPIILFYVVELELADLHTAHGLAEGSFAHYEAMMTWISAGDDEPNGGADALPALVAVLTVSRRTPAAYGDMMARSLAHNEPLFVYARQLETVMDGLHAGESHRLIYRGVVPVSASK